MKQRLTHSLLEGALLGLFMISACFFTALLEHPSSLLSPLVPHALLRRFLIGLAMGLTAVFLIYSPLGKRSGAHMNPSVTLTFWRLGRISGIDAVFYGLFQTLGGAAGVWLCAAIAPAWIKNPAVNYVVTIPGSAGPLVAWFAEFAISFILMATVLMSMRRPGLSKYTGFLAGVCVALFVTFEAPLSGMSINPARTIASAWPSGLWTGLWIYLTAPPLAMLAAAEFIGKGRRWSWCAKLIHDPRYECLFCKTQGSLS